MPLVVLFTRPLFWLSLAILAGLLLLLAWRLRLRWLPAWALRLLLVVLVLAGLFWPRGEQRRGLVSPPQVMVVDQSDSLTPEQRLAARQQALVWQAAGENRMLVSYGDRPQVVLQPESAWPAPDGRASDLGSALSLANDLLNARQAAAAEPAAPGIVYLASDGLVENTSGVEAAVSRLVRQGHTLNVLPLSPRQDPADGFVGPLWVPSNLWAGTEFDAVLSVFPPQGTGLADLKLLVNGADSGLQAEALEGSLYRFRVPAQPQGLTTLQVSADFGGSDPFPANNDSFAAVQVFPAPAVLFITPQPVSSEAGAFISLLESANIQVNVLPPEGIPSDLRTLEAYRVIFMHDLLVNQLSQESQLSLEVFVSRLAGGLVFLGGRNSYTLGGYQNTRLEPMLPVQLEPPPRSERPPIVFMLVMDHSASMGTGPNASAPRPIELAREAAMRAIETMRPQDYLGVLSFSNWNDWTVSLRLLGDGLALREALDAVSRVEADGGTHMFQALADALTALQELPASAPPSRHILVLSDGQSQDGSPGEFKALAELARSLNISISTIAFGDDADEQLMNGIAEAGKGRYYKVTQADELPRIMIYESQAARAENVQTGETTIEPGETAHPVLSGLDPQGLPSLEGYNALTSKVEAGAEDILVSSSFGDPILSAWQYGLGRVVAWTGDIGEEWTGAWANPAMQAQFWSQVVRYALVNPALGQAQVNVQVEPTRMVVEAFIQDAAGEPVNLAQVTFTYADAAGAAHSFPLPQQSAGSYRAELPRPPEGAYRAVLSYPGADGNRLETAAPFAVNPPLEWLPLDASAGAANLQAWADLAGGQVLASGLALLESAPTAPAEEPEGRGAWWWLLFALVLFWPLEIAIRRKWLPWL
jgi:uncharacterized membrane protein